MGVSGIQSIIPVFACVCSVHPCACLAHVTPYPSFCPSPSPLPLPVSPAARPCSPFVSLSRWRRAKVLVRSCCSLARAHGQTDSRGTILSWVRALCLLPLVLIICVWLRASCCGVSMAPMAPAPPDAQWKSAAASSKALAPHEMHCRPMPLPLY